ncbi:MULTISPECIES: CBS domain-containing protein [Methanoculleus]|jgi:CBS domain-containing protein|uniref:CBS domain-containing protein n=1 Tax=Methanoculleus thermophilus TaxID=2200 RepID=A0A1G9C3G3_9EURY|nr:MULTISPECIES: CBS domain-containing protein [Methanoculleus]NLN09860.1 CBS domain-containing protein [Methanoculleus thermophilus]SDK46177.1 CBS domain-containing protein [Methanoculleus thermophilus]HQD26845.1 CBS domain-containing protein [Methanoculleus thermophilus]
MQPHSNNSDKKPADRLLKMPGKFDRGPVDFKSRPADYEGEIMTIATRNVVTAQRTTPIIQAVEIMTREGFRRLPIIDAGTRHLRGIVTVTDIIDFMGGGDKFNLVQVKHGGNFLAAINEGLREIMTSNTITMPVAGSIGDAVDIIVNRNIGGIPITDPEGTLKGIVTERDVMKVLTTEHSNRKAEDIMKPSVRVTSPDTPIGKVCEEMIKCRFRRLPVVVDDVLCGIVTATDIMNYLGKGKAFEQLTTGDAAEVMGAPVRSLLSGELHTITPDRNIHDIAVEMIQRRVGALPVIEDSHLVGLVTEYDLVKAFAEE